MKETHALIIFAREPKEGRVKTRLLKDLDAPLVTSLYKAFIQDVIQQISFVENCTQFLYYANEESNSPFLSQFSDQLTINYQLGDSLGERMYLAARDCLTNGYQKVVIIGTDCVEITAPDIEKAYKSLDDNDFCLGPSDDGGYYLIGMKVLRDEVFTDIEWGTGKVLTKTLENITQIEHNVHLLEAKEDIDTVDSLNRFVERMDHFAGAEHTKKILKDNYKLKTK